MNLILLLDTDFTAEDRVVLTGRRFAHMMDVHRAVAGDELTVGVLDGRTGVGRVEEVRADAVEMTVSLDAAPPPPLPLTLVLALPRPKVLNRVIAAATSMGIKRIYLVNAWKVEKSYWSTPRLLPDSLREQAILGLEQARDTTVPTIEVRRLFRPFVEDELPQLISGTRALVAHPTADEPMPRHIPEPVTLAIGPEGGFIPAEVDSLTRIGFQPVHLGERILRVETAIPYCVARLF